MNIIIDLFECCKIFFPSITMIAIKMFLSLSDTICIAERTFRTSRKVNTWLRSTTDDNRLMGYDLMSIHTYIRSS